MHIIINNYKIIIIITGFDTTGPFILTLSRIVSIDLPKFFSFYIIIELAYGCAVSLTTNNGEYNFGSGLRLLLL